MLLQNIRAKIGARLSGKSEEGFTLIELLVVMLILGILAAIALPAFFNQKNKASDSKAKEYAHSAEVAMETCSTESQTGSYTGCAATTLKAIEPTLPSATATTGERFTSTPTANGKGYAVKVYSSTGNSYSVVRGETGSFEYTCTIPTATSDHGGCSITGNGTSGTWQR